MPPTIPPINVPSLAERLSALFGISGVDDVTQVSGGFMCQNFSVDTPQGRYFLKQYRNRLSTVVHEIKHAERYFADQGIPIILPVSDRHGRGTFWMDGSWYSLFPFVDGKSPSSAAFSGRTIDALADMLARIHRAGARFDADPFQPLRLWDRDMFYLERVEVEQTLLAKRDRTPDEDAVLDLIRLKTRLVAENTLRPNDVQLPFDTLLHGDYIHQNVFTDAAGEVTHVYDLEKSCRGPRAYELCRFLLVSFFDDGWGERHYEAARRALAAYREAFPIGKEEFARGFRAYRTHITHMIWIESSIVLHRSERYKQILPSHARRITELSKDPDGFVERVWS